MGETATRNRNGVSRDRHVADNFSMLTVETLTHPLIDLLSHAPPDETRRNEVAGRLRPGMANRMKSIKSARRMERVPEGGTLQWKRRQKDVCQQLAQ